MATVPLPQDFKDFLKLLEDEGVEYLLIGGYAVGYYGYPRATADIDVWIAVSQQNAVKAVRVFQSFGMKSPEITVDLFLDKGNIIRMGLPPMRIEVQTEISGVEFHDCFTRRRRVDLDGIEVNLIDLEDLKANKRASGRHKDLEDIDHLP